jgi:hypothetical protein
MLARKVSAIANVTATRPRYAAGSAAFRLRLEDDAGGDINTVGT